MDRLEGLRKDLWDRWRQQGDRLPIVGEPPHASEGVLCSRGPVFDLKKYGPRKFAPGGRTSSQPFPGVDNHVYHLDGRGRPVHTEFTDSYNQVDWRGAYSYRDDAAARRSILRSVWLYPCSEATARPGPRGTSMIPRVFG